LQGLGGIPFSRTIDRRNVAIDHRLQGLVIVGIGVAFIALQVMSFDADEPISYGLIFLFGGGGLLAYYGIGTVSNK
jgi:hypothetical protein